MRLAADFHLLELPGLELVLAHHAPVIRRGIHREARRERAIHRRRYLGGPVFTDVVFVRSCSTGGRQVLLSFDRAQLREQGEKIGLVTGLGDFSVPQLIKADSADGYLLLCR